MVKCGRGSLWNEFFFEHSVSVLAPIIAGKGDPSQGRNAKNLLRLVQASAVESLSCMGDEAEAFLEPLCSLVAMELIAKILPGDGVPVPTSLDKMGILENRNIQEHKGYRSCLDELMQRSWYCAEVC